MHAKLQIQRYTVIDHKPLTFQEGRSMRLGITHMAGDTDDETGFKKKLIDPATGTVVGPW
jgi:hypothetical protein